jgi:hypothetical protein
VKKLIKKTTPTSIWKESSPLGQDFYRPSSMLNPHPHALIPYVLPLLRYSVNTELDEDRPWKLLNLISNNFEGYLGIRDRILPCPMSMVMPKWLGNGCVPGHTASFHELMPWQSLSYRTCQHTFIMMLAPGVTYTYILICTYYYKECLPFSLILCWSTSHLTTAISHPDLWQASGFFPKIFELKLGLLHGILQWS